MLSMHETWGKTVSKQDENDNETLILNKMVTNHKNWHKITLNKNSQNITKLASKL